MMLLPADATDSWGLLPKEERCCLYWPPAEGSLHSWGQYSQRNSPVPAVAWPGVAALLPVVAVVVVDAGHS